MRQGAFWAQEESMRTVTDRTPSAPRLIRNGAFWAQKVDALSGKVRSGCKKLMPDQERGVVGCGKSMVYNMFDPLLGKLRV
jgi:hypothetical protein